MEVGFKLIQSLSDLNMFYQLFTLAFGNLKTPLLKDERWIYSVLSLIFTQITKQDARFPSAALSRQYLVLISLHLHPNCEADRVSINNPSVFPTPYYSSSHREMGSCFFPWDLGGLVTEFPRDGHTRQNNLYEILLGCYLLELKSGQEAEYSSREHQKGHFTGTETEVPFFTLRPSWDSCWQLGPTCQYYE